MATVVDRFRKFAAEKRPRFVSNGAVVALRHTLLPGAKQAQLEWLQRQSHGVSDQLVEFYRWADGARLFENESDAEDCFFFVPIDDMEAEKKGMEPWIMGRTQQADYEYCEEISEDGQLTLFGPPRWWESALVFAGIGYSPERYFLATNGPWQGNVFLYVHDGDYSVRTHLSFDNMLEEIYSSPAKFIGWAVNYPIERYESDGS